MDYYALKPDQAFLISFKAFIFKNNRLLVLRNSQLGFDTSDGKWSLPGGLLEMDEDLHNCLAREVKEEIGLTVTVGFPKIIGETSYKDFVFKDGRKCNIRFIEIGFSISNWQGEITLGDEHNKYRWVTKDELKKMTISPDAKDLINYFLSGAEGTRTLDLPRDRRTL
jgi:8-oxo-dGTP diphosphatase